MARKHKNMENEKCTLQELDYGEKTENHENDIHTPQDMEYGEKH